MKATMSTAVIGVSLAQQSSPAAFSDGSDSGFSEVLSGVHTKQAQQGAVGSVRKEDASYAETADASVNPDAGKAPASESEGTWETLRTVSSDDPRSILSFTDIEYREVSITLKEELAQLVIGLSGGDEDEEGKIIDALLKILKKMQEKEDGAAVSLAMLLLTAMLGGGEEKPAELTVPVKNASAEITEISGSCRAETTLTEKGGFSEGTALSEENLSDEAALSEGGENFPEAADAQNESPTVHTEAAAVEEPLTAETEPRTVGTERVTSEPSETVQPEAAEPSVREPVKTAEAIDPTPFTRETAERQPEIPAERDVTAQEQPIREAEPKTAEQLLSDILDKARRELGLTKAEFTAEPKPTEPKPTEPKTAEARTAEARTEVRLPQAEESAADENRPDSGGQSQRFSARELFLSPNHKDGRSELERILGGGKEQQFDPNAAIPRETVREVEIPLGNEPKTDAIPIERQLADELLARSETVNGGRSEFTMVLNPESLGRITVRMISAGGRVQVSIAAENDATRQLLESRGEQIGTALKSSGVELERYQVVSGREEAQLMQDNYDGSSKNPYGHREEPAEEQPADDGEDFLEILQQL